MICIYARTRSVWAKRREEQQLAWKRKAEVRAMKREKLEAYTNHGFKYGGSSGQITMQMQVRFWQEEEEKEGWGGRAFLPLNHQHPLP